MPFFLTAPFALFFSALILLRSGPLALTTPWSSLTLSLTHMGTLGFIVMATIGVVYLMAPQLMGTAIPATRVGCARGNGWLSGYVQNARTG